MDGFDLDDGFMQIANKIIDSLVNSDLTLYEFKVIFAVIRKTYGWKKKEDSISLSQLSIMTGISKANVSHTLKGLKNKNIIFIKDNPINKLNGKIIGFQKYPDKWINVKKTGVSKNNVCLNNRRCLQGQQVVSMGTIEGVSVDTTKERKKENKINKDDFLTIKNQESFSSSEPKEKTTEDLDSFIESWISKKYPDKTIELLGLLFQEGILKLDRLERQKYLTSLEQKLSQVERKTWEVIRKEFIPDPQVGDPTKNTNYLFFWDEVLSGYYIYWDQDKLYRDELISLICSKKLPPKADEKSGQELRYICNPDLRKKEDDNKAVVTGADVGFSDIVNHKTKEQWDEIRSRKKGSHGNAPSG